MASAPTKARQRAYERLIKTAHACADALSESLAHDPSTRPDDQRLLLIRQLRELAGYYEQATWWRA